jgi:hypothetical protein
MMIRLTYSKASDEFATVTVIGNEAGIFDLWKRLKNSPTDEIQNVRLTNLDGHPIDPTKGLHAVMSQGTDLGRSTY